MNDLEHYFPRKLNESPFVPFHTFEALESKVAETRIVLPVCSFGTPFEKLATLGPLVLPPLWNEALEVDLKDAILNRILHCFPYYAGTRKRRDTMGRLEVREYPRVHFPPPDSPKILAYSVDTAVEEHGPHLPLGTDTLQSYAVLNRLEEEFSEITVGAPLEYGHLTWGLPFGLSIDITPDLVTRYVKGFVNALLQWVQPEALYVVDIHGSQVHRDAVQRGLQQSQCSRWKFRWLHEPLAAQAQDRGDFHAGGVETRLIEHINPALTDPAWWPGRMDELEAGQMKVSRAVELSANLFDFIDEVENHPLNGIVGEIRNAEQVSGEDLMNRMLETARRDIRELSELR